VTLDSERWVCKHPEEFRIFCRLVEAGGDRVSGAALNRLPGCKGRPDKIIAKLPPALRAVVCSDDGRGGRLLDPAPAKNAVMGHDKTSKRDARRG